MNPATPAAVTAGGPLVPANDPSAGSMLAPTQSGGGGAPLVQPNTPSATPDASTTLRKQQKVITSPTRTHRSCRSPSERLASCRKIPRSPRRGYARAHHLRHRLSTPHHFPGRVDPACVADSLRPAQGTRNEWRRRRTERQTAGGVSGSVIRFSLTTVVAERRWSRRTPPVTCSYQLLLDQE